MWNSLHRKHCSDEQLLAQLDGELSALRADWVKKHLNLCWECRSRAHDLEMQTQCVAKALGEDSLFQFERTADAKLRFLTWRDEFERTFKPRPRSPVGLSRRTAMIASLCAIVMLMVAGSRALRKMEPSEILARTRGAEANLYATPLLVHQTFRLRMSEIKPEPSERTGQLEIWSDSDGQRFASRWQDASGSLRHAVWRTGAGRDYVYNPKIAPRVLPSKKEGPKQVRSLADLSASARDLENLQLGLIEWIETRQWRPIEASSDLNAFVSQEGAVLHADHDEKGICLQAQRAFGSTQVQVSLELDPISYTPRLQRIRFEQSGRVMELELIAGKCEFMNSARLNAAVFEPEKTLMPSLARVVFHPPVVPTAKPREIAAYVDTVDLVPLEIEAHYALHRARACLGEPFEVIPIIGKNVPGYVEIRGIVETRERKRELQAALAELTSVNVNITSVEDAVREKPPLGKDASEAEVETRTRLSSQPSIIQPALEEFFAKNRQNTGPIRQQIAGFSIQAISLSQNLLTQAWALRRLAERYGASKKSDLLPRSKWLLEVMIRDHMAALAVDNQRIRALLDPVLLQVRAHSDLQLSSSMPDENAADWRTLSLSLFETNKKIDALVRALFAASYPPQMRDLGSLDSSEKADEAVMALVEALGRLDLELVMADEDSYRVLPE